MTELAARLDALTEIATRLARVDDVTLAGADPETRDRYRELAQEVVDYIGEDDFHWGCTSAEVVDDRVASAWNAGWEKAYETAKQRVIDGLTRLEKASMVEAETVVEIVPRIREMDAWDNDAPLDGDDVGEAGV